MSKRIRHVMGGDEVAHTWANPRSEDDNARVSRGNLYFQGDTIYSYGSHFPIARHMKNEHGEPAVLFTTNTYGPTTGKHLRITRRACHHLTVFDVPLIETSSSTFNAGDHAYNMQHFQSVYDGIIERAERCSVNSYAGVNYYTQAAQNVVQEGADYAAFFDLDDCVVPAWKGHIAWLVARYARLTSPEAKAERETKARRKNARLLERWIAGDDISLPGSIDPTEAETKVRQAVLMDRYSSEIAEYASGERDHLTYLTPGLQDCMTDAQQAERRAFDLERHKEKIEQWRAGERVHFGYGSGVPCMLRLRVSFRDNLPGPMRDATEIETSWGARFPVEDATRAFRFINIIRKRGECYKPNGEQAPRLAQYRIDRIAADGTVRAGCHTVAWPEIEGIARQLGLVS